MTEFLPGRITDRPSARASRLDVADRVSVPAGRELRVDQVLARHLPQLLPPPGLGVGEPFPWNVGERRSPPERERGPQQRRRGIRPTAGQLGTPARRQLFEPLGVELARAGPQLVPAGPADDRQPVTAQLSNSLVWRCPARRILAQYDRHLTGSHLDVGPGTG
jgi:hypothetical protein